MIACTDSQRVCDWLATINEELSLAILPGGAVHSDDRAAYEILPAIAPTSHTRGIYCVHLHLILVPMAFQRCSLRRIPTIWSGSGRCVVLGYGCSMIASFMAGYRHPDSHSRSNHKGSNPIKLPLPGSLLVQCFDLACLIGEIPLFAIPPHHCRFWPAPTLTSKHIAASYSPRTVLRPNDTLCCMRPCSSDDP